MKEYPATLVELPDESCWVRFGGKMLRIDEFPWLVGQPVAQTVTVGGAAPKLALDGVKAIADANGLKNGSVTVEVAVPKADLTEVPDLADRVAKRVNKELGDRASLLRKPAKKAESEAPSKRGGKTTRTDAALIAKARKLVEHMGYSIARAAAAVQVNYSTIYGIAQRDGWDIPKRGEVKDAAPKEAKEKPSARCQNCKRKTTSSPCQHCFERVPALEVA